MIAVSLATHENLYDRLLGLGRPFHYELRIWERPRLEG